MIRSKRDFYAEMCRVERWNARTLRQKIDSMLYRAHRPFQKTDELIRHWSSMPLRNEDRLTPDLVFRDPYFLDFLGLQDRYLEKDLEDAILRGAGAISFWSSGAGFSFIARQKRIQVDNDDYYLDLLFYHRQAQDALVAIDLKLGDFKPADKGRWSCICAGWTNTSASPMKSRPSGLMLCAGKKRETVELLAS